MPNTAAAGFLTGFLKDQSKSLEENIDANFELAKEGRKRREAGQSAMLKIRKDNESNRQYAIQAIKDGDGAVVADLLTKDMTHKEARTKQIEAYTKKWASNPDTAFSDVDKRYADDPNSEAYDSAWGADEDYYYAKRNAYAKMPIANLLGIAPDHKDINRVARKLKADKEAAPVAGKITPLIFGDKKEGKYGTTAINEGNQTVTYEMLPSGKQGKELARGPRWKPEDMAKATGGGKGGTAFTKEGLTGLYTDRLKGIEGVDVEDVNQMAMLKSLSSRMAVEYQSEYGNEYSEQFGTDFDTIFDETSAYHLKTEESGFGTLWMGADDITLRSPETVAIIKKQVERYSKMPKYANVPKIKLIKLIGAEIDKLED